MFVTVSSSKGGKDCAEEVQQPLSTSIKMFGTIFSAKGGEAIGLGVAAGHRVDKEQR